LLLCKPESLFTCSKSAAGTAPLKGLFRSLLASAVLLSRHHRASPEGWLTSRVLPGCWREKWCPTGIAEKQEVNFIWNSLSWKFDLDR